MARIPLLERTSIIRTMGVLFLALCVFFTWITYAVFNKKFIDSVPVTVTGVTAGAQLPSNADVKLRGMIVGELRGIKPTADGVIMKVAIKPSALHQIPRDVTARIVPKTLFGEKFIELIPPATPEVATLRAGDNIANAVVPIEVETLLNDLYPLLEAVQPAELSYTLSAISTALEGRGKQLGATLVSTNDYLKKVNPDVSKLVDDVVKLGTVSDGYADAMPELGRLLKNVVVTGDTIVARRAQLEAFYSEGSKLSDALTAFLHDNGDNLITLAHESRPVLDVLGTYSVVFPCVLQTVTELTPKLNSAFRDQTLHIKLTVLGDQPTGYDSDEHGVIPSKATIDANRYSEPSCHTLPNVPYTHDEGNRAPIPPYSVYELLGLKDKDPARKPHNKFERRTAVANDDSLIDLVQPSLAGNDSPAQRARLKSLLALSLGIRAGSVPDVGALLVSPILRGTAVSFDETR